MIVLDTNLVSEIMRLRPEPAVLAWFDAQVPSALWLTAVGAAELMFGVARMDQGARRQQLARNLSAMLETDFDGRVLPFDLAAASVYAQLAAQRERIGRPVAMADAQIASVCLAHGASLATRNHKHFDGLGLTIINPWGTAALSPR